jgi:P-type Cu+ transporter
MAAIFTIPTFIIGVVGMMLLPQGNHFRQWCEGIGWWGGASRAVILLWIIATIVQFGIARYELRHHGLPQLNTPSRIFYVRGWASLHFKRRWSTLIRFGNMNVLVSLSIGVAYIASVVMMVLDIRRSPEEAAMSMQMNSYFDCCVFLTFFILAGKALEARAKLKVRTALSDIF